MKQATGILSVTTRGPGLIEITDLVRVWLAGQALSEGLLTLFCRHTSASLLLHENASPDARADLEGWLARMAPEHPGLYAHADEGTDDMPAHLRAVLTGAHLAIPVIGGAPALGQWQGIFLAEHRRAGQPREVALHVIGM